MPVLQLTGAVTYLRMAVIEIRLYSFLTDLGSLGTSTGVPPRMKWTGPTFSVSPFTQKPQKEKPHRARKLERFIR